MTEFPQWLVAATRKLPTEIREIVRDELTCHYEDALYEYRSQGFDEGTARNAALQDLGDARLTARALQQIHQPAEGYTRAGLISMLPAIWLLLSIVVITLSQAYLATRMDYTALFQAIFITGWYVLISAVSVYSTVYTLNMLKRLIGHPMLDWPIRLIQIGMGLLLPMTAIITFINVNVRVAIVNDPLILFINDFTRLPLLETLIAAMVVLVGMGWLWLGVRLDHFRRECFGLSLPISGLLLLNGLGLIMMAYGFVMGATLSAYIWITLVVITGTSKSAAFTLLFFRARSKNVYSNPT